MPQDKYPMMGHRNDPEPSSAVRFATVEYQIGELRKESEGRHQENRETLNSILGQVKATNGRVTSLETSRAITESQRKEKKDIGQWIQWALLALLALGEFLKK